MTATPVTQAIEGQRLATEDAERWRGLGASHQAGWRAWVALLLQPGN